MAGHSRGRPANDPKFIAILRVMKVDDCILYPVTWTEHHAYRNSVTSVERNAGLRFRTVGFNDKFYVIRVA